MYLVERISTRVTYRDDMTSGHLLAAMPNAMAHGREGLPSKF